METACAWTAAIERRDGPTCLLLTRQNVPFQARAPESIAAIGRGGYVLADSPAVRAVINRITEITTTARKAFLGGRA